MTGHRSACVHRSVKHCKMLMLHLKLTHIPTHALHSRLAAERPDHAAVLQESVGVFMLAFSNVVSAAFFCLEVGALVEDEHSRRVSCLVVLLVHQDSTLLLDSSCCCTGLLGALALVCLA